MFALKEKKFIAFFVSVAAAAASNTPWLGRAEAFARACAQLFERLQVLALFPSTTLHEVVRVRQRVCSEAVVMEEVVAPTGAGPPHFLLVDGDITTTTVQRAAVAGVSKPTVAARQFRPGSALGQHQGSQLE